MQLLYDDGVVPRRLPVDPLGSTLFLGEQEKEMVYDLIPIFRPDAGGRPSPQALLFSIILGLPRLDDGIPFAAALISRLWHQEPNADPAWHDHGLRLQRWLEDINSNSNGLIYMHHTPANIGCGQARTIDQLKIDPELQDALFGELLTEDKVDLATDRRLSRYVLIVHQFGFANSSLCVIS